MDIAASTWTDLDAADVEVVFLPVGSTEQHGPHAPTGTDSIAAERIAREAAADREDAIVAPTIPVGVSAEHRQFTGTLWVSPETFRRYVRETIESCLAHDWRRIVVVNGHGGNSDALREVCAEISRAERAYAVAYTYFDAIDAADLGHAGPVETSIVADERPESVHPDRYDDAAAGAGDSFGEYHVGTNLAYDFAEFTDNGTIGDPRGATAERGDEVVESAVDALDSLVDRVLDRSLDAPAHR
ncbi:creatininase family protein [Halococcoides cellulosivorans]|uniref:Creatininase n=1 Tax=Halococcoides cellulosivorans TaxID=1679096 RepID=A0A2R4WXR5_9EURY|nr:creatininase family protein [Halococcoides cellulosivorans]AWB26337.1 creatininase [Halococcoides cellulosivorans]